MSPDIVPINYLAGSKKMISTIASNIMKYLCLFDLYLLRSIRGFRSLCKSEQVLDLLHNSFELIILLLVGVGVLKLEYATTKLVSIRTFF